MQRFLLNIFGRRIATIFGGVSFLITAVLASLYLVSGYAVENYVKDQLGRVPWDIAAGQRDSVRNSEELKARLGRLPGVESSAFLGFLPVQNTQAIRVQVDGQPLPVRWIAVVAASRADLLPPGLRQSSPATVAPNAPLQVRASFVRAEDEMGRPLTVRPGADLRLVRTSGGGDGHSHSHDDVRIDFSEQAPEILFEATLAASPGEIERQEFNKWMLGRVGSMSYLPELAIVIAVPEARFKELAAVLDQAFEGTEGMHGGDAPPPYTPEAIQLLRLDHKDWVRPWNLEATREGLVPLLNRISADAQELSLFPYVNSDLFAIVARMSEISKLIGVVTLLISIPLLWLGWAVAKTLSALLLENERRLIGLALLRGIPMSAVSRALYTALLIGGVGGGLLGLAAGLGATVLGQMAAGYDAPPAAVFVGSSLYFLGFIVLGTLLSVFSGRSMIKQVRHMTPREAAAYITSGGARVGSQTTSWVPLTLSVIAFLLGLYKIVSWLIGPSGRADDGNASAFVALADGLLGFIAIPLFLVGISGILTARVGVVRYFLTGLVAPFAGRLRWFIAEHMVLGRKRVAGALFISSLAISLALMPQVSADAFYGRVLRGIQASVGGDLQLEFDLSGPHANPGQPTTIAAYQAAIAPRVQAIEAALEKNAGVNAGSLIQQFTAPGVYLPNQSGLTLDVIRSPDEYLRTVYSEDGLGGTRRFGDIITATDQGRLAASEGFLNIRSVPLNRNIILGEAQGGASVLASFSDVFRFLPGQPSIEVAQREGFAAAEVDYANFTLVTDARAITSQAAVSKGSLATLEVLPSRTVFLIRAADLTPERVDAIVKSLPFRPQSVRWVGGERVKASKDMFISLALENMKVYVIGGLLLAVAGIFAVGLANYFAERRVLALLRVRGAPVSAQVRISLSIFLSPVVAGVLLGIMLALIAGHGLAEAIWRLPRIHGAAGLVERQFHFSLTSGALVLGFSLVLIAAAISLALWPFRRTAGANLGKA